MYASFVGTRRGLTAPQRHTLERVLASQRLRIVRLSLPSTEGADAEAHALAEEAGIEVRLRAGDSARARAELLAQDGGLLIACPAGRDGEAWEAVQHMRQIGFVDVLCVWPNGETSSWRRKTQRPVPR